MSSRLDRRQLELYARTVAHIPPAQLVHRVRLRTLRAVLARRPEAMRRRWTSVPTGSRWPADFEPLDAGLSGPITSIDANEKGRFDFIGLPIELGSPIDWTPDQAPQLWRYHLHYWEWAWPLLRQSDRQAAQARFAALWRSWKQGTTFGRWDEWSPYVVSLRTWVLCGLYGPLAAGTSIDDELRTDVALHLNFVARNLERDVGGNHLIKNLKALIGGAVFLDDRARLALGRRLLERQLRIQVLGDGGHFERSPSYHAQVLGDLIDVAGLLDTADEPPVEGLEGAITAMRRWLSTLLMPDREVPVMNDAEYVGKERLHALGVEAALPRGLTVLADSGYAVLRNDRLHLMVDIGPPCPPALPAHAHADCLSFELAVDGTRVVVDPGTSTYQPGARRAWERSTRSHNTVAVDGEDQTEVWGTFRAARLATPVVEVASDEGDVIAVTASHEGYERLPGRPRHRRTWRLSGNRLVIDDEISGSGRHSLTSRLQFAPGLTVFVTGRTAIAGPLSIRFDAPTGDTRLSLAGAEPGGVATGFGPPSAACAVDLLIDAEVPVRWSTTIEIADDPEG